MQILGVARTGHEINCSSGMFVAYMQLGRIFSLSSPRPFFSNFSGNERHVTMAFRPAGCTTRGSTMTLCECCLLELCKALTLIPLQLPFIQLPAKNGVCGQLDILFSYSFPTTWFRLNDVFSLSLFLPFPAHHSTWDLSSHTKGRDMQSVTREFGGVKKKRF